MFLLFFFFKQKTAYEMRISDWSSDVCSSDLRRSPGPARTGDWWKSAVEWQGHRRHSHRERACPCHPSESPWRRRTRPELAHQERKSVVWGKSVSLRVVLGGRRILKKTIILSPHHRVVIQIK